MTLIFLGWVEDPKLSIKYVEYTKYFKTGIEIAASSPGIMSDGTITWHHCHHGLKPLLM